MEGETHVDLRTYRPLPENEKGLTPLQKQERRESVRRASLVLYDTEMTTEKAELVAASSTAELMLQLELDELQAEDLKKLAKGHLKRLQAMVTIQGANHG